MSTPESVNQSLRAIKEAELKNPLLRLGLGELVSEMHKLVVLDPNVIKTKIPKESRYNYEKYQNLILEINRREREYSPDEFKKY